MIRNTFVQRQCSLPKFDSHFNADVGKEKENAVAILPVWSRGMGGVNDDINKHGPRAGG